MEIKLPDRLKIEFEEDLDIEDVHNYVLNLFERSKTARLNKLDEMIQKCGNSPSKTLVEKDVNQEKIDKLRKLRKDISEEVDLKQYTEQANILLEHYNNSENKKKYINEYLRFLDAYIHIDVIKPKDNNREADYCAKSSKDEHSDRENFKRALLRIQGKQNCKILEDILVKLDKYFDSFDLITRQKAKSISLKTNGKKEGTSRELMERALKEIGNPSYYDRINIICSIYWGWKLPDFTVLEPKIMEEYENTQKIFLSLPNKGRSSNLNLQYRLFKHLELHKEELKELGYILKKDDFKLIGTRVIFLQYDEIWKQMTQGAGLIFIPTT